MKITSLSLHNIACFEDAKFSFGDIALIQGKNESGKSTLLDAWKYLWDRGHDPDLLRGGTTEGEIVAEFDEGTKLRALLSAAKTERMTKPAGGKRWNRGREFIDSVSNSLSYDPLQFLLKSDKEMVSDVLRLMPIEVAATEIEATLAPIENQPEIVNGLDLAGRSPLEIINAIRSAVYDARTTVHVAADTHEKHAGELSESLKAMAVDGTDWKAELGKLQVQLAGIDGAEERLREKLTGEVKVAIADYKFNRDLSVSNRQREIDAEIAKLKAELGRHDRVCDEACNLLIENVKADARAKLDAFTAQQAEERTRLTAELAKAEQSYSISLRLQSTRDSIAEAKKQADEARSKWKAMTACLENIDKLKADVAGRLPLGIDISDGRICRSENGALVPFGKWNDASKWTLALKIATLCHGQAGFVCIDSTGFDAFDPSHKRSFLAACKKYVETEGMQFVLCTVSDGDLKVVDVAE